MVKKVLLTLIILLTPACTGWHTTPYVEVEHASNIVCGPSPSFGVDCPETDWNSYGIGYRATSPSGLYFDVKAADQIGDEELEGIGPHAYWKFGYEFK